MLANHLKAVAFTAILACLSCSDSSKSASPEANAQAASGTAQPVSAKTAYWAMYKSAYSWAKDLEDLGLESKTVAGVKNADGKAGMWSATFGSPSRREARVFTYSVVSAADIYKGVSVGHSLVWGGPSRDAMPIQNDAFSVDSDAAFKTASDQAKSWLSKNPGKDATLTLGNNPSRFSAPVWYIVWGDKKSGYAVFINATTGAVAK